MGSSTIIRYWQKKAFLCFVLSAICFINIATARNVPAHLQGVLLKKAKVHAFMQKAHGMVSKHGQMAKPALSARCNQDFCDENETSRAAKKIAPWFERQALRIKNLAKKAMCKQRKARCRQRRDTQTQAHLRYINNIPAGQEVDYNALLEKALAHYFSIKKGGKLPACYSGIKDAAYVIDLAKKIAHKEEEFPDHYVFYHAYNGEFSIVYDFFQELTKWFYLNPEANFLLRFDRKTFNAYHSINDFIDHWHAKGKPLLWGWDNDEYRECVICVNFALFGNVNCIWGKECTFDYFLDSFSCCKSKAEKLLESFFSRYEFPRVFIKDLVALYEANLAKSGGHMVQYFVHKDSVDDVASLFRPCMFFYNQKITDSFDEEKKRHTDISSILDMYVKTPELFRKNEIPLDALQGRLLLNPSIFSDSSAVQVFRYTAQPVSDDAWVAYREGVSTIAQQIVENWVAQRIDDEQALDSCETFGEVTNLQRLLKSFKFAPVGAF